MDLSDRIKHLLNHADMTQVSFAKHIGATKQQIQDLKSGKTKTLSDSMMNKIISAFPDVNLQWLLTGEGEMLKQQYKVDEIEELSLDEQTKVRQMIDSGEVTLVPLIHIDSVGGIHSDNSIISPEYIERFLPVAGARQGDIAIFQSGNSMAPAIPSGAILLIREVEGWRDYIGYGDVFVLLLNDQRRITKEIRRYNEDPSNFYWCVSYNPDVADEELPKRIVRRVWKVIKVLIDKGW